MKRCFAMVLCFLLILTVTACGYKTSEVVNDEPPWVYDELLEGQSQA